MKNCVFLNGVNDKPFSLKAWMGLCLIIFWEAFLQMFEMLMYFL